MAILFKKKWSFSRLYYQICFHYGILNSKELLRNCERYLHKIHEIYLTWFLLVSVLNKKMWAGLLVSKQNPYRRAISHRSQNLKMERERHFWFHRNSKYPRAETRNNIWICEVYFPLFSEITLRALKTFSQHGLMMCK